MARRPGWTRAGRAIAIGLSVAILGLGLALFRGALDGPLGSSIGTDINQYLRATDRWIAGGTPYLANEVSGPFMYGQETFLHPPIALYLFAPFTVLPLVLWWAIPLTAIGYCIVSWRPAMWSWPILALALAWPRFHGALLAGNSDLWICAAVALGLRFGWPALLIAVKPSLIVLGLVGVRRRAWWIGAGAVVLLALPFGHLWQDWLNVVTNSPGDVTYSLPNLLWVAMPVVAWLSRTVDNPMRGVGGPHDLSPDCAPRT